MVSTRTILKTLSANVAVAAATLTGGPAAGASLAAFLATPKGQKLLDFQVENAADASGVVLDDRARGGFVMEPTLGLTGEMGPEFVMPLRGFAQEVKKRSPRARRSDKKLSAAFKEANRRMRTKSGKLRKGKTQGDIARLAHRLRKKM